MKYCFFLIICIFRFETGLVALEFSDFYENGQLIEIRDPPYFDTTYDYCNYHVLNSPKSFYLDDPYAHIGKSAGQSLQDAIRACWWHQKIPPPYYWKGKQTYGYRERWMCSFSYFFSRYSPDFPWHPNWPKRNCLEYSEYVQKYAYLFYWFDISYDLIRTSLKRRLQEKEDELRVRGEKYGWQDRKCLEEAIEYLKHDIAGLGECKRQSIDCIAKSFEETTDLFFQIYNECIEVHKHPTAIYERGRIYFDRGDTLGFVGDIFTLSAMGYASTPEIEIELGKAYNDANLYNHAIKILSAAIQKKPQLKEAYFERAVAYFETGNLQCALADYLNYDNHPHFVNDPNYQHFKFSLGAGIGCFKGGADSAINFVPSLFSTVYGLGKGLWTLVSDPIGISKELVENAIASLYYIKDNFNSELLSKLVPELKECIEKWDQLGEEQKGYYVGYIIGRYGVDTLICGSSVRAIQLYRNVKRANALLTLETAIASPQNAEILAKESEEFFICRNAFKKKCKLHMGQQEKHIPGANNFQPGKGELTVSIGHLEEIVASRLGEGVPTRFSYGEAGYKELVDFEEIIGIHVDRKTKTVIKTQVGEIHYNIEGEYHVVPVDPNKLERIRNKRKTHNE